MQSSSSKLERIRLTVDGGGKLWQEMAEICEAMVCELAETLAEEFGLSISKSESARFACAFISTEALKGGLELVLPAVASGVGFSATGLTLAIIHKKIRELHKKLDTILEASRKTARDKLEEAMVAFENGNYKHAYEEFGKVSDRSTEAFNLSQDEESKFLATRMKLLSVVMVKSYDEEQRAFIPFHFLSASRQREVAMLMRTTVEKMLEGFDSFKPTFVDSVMFKSKAKRKLHVGRVNEILTSVYPFLSAGLRWTQPRDTLVDTESDVLQIRIDPKFVPEGREAALSILVGKDAKSGALVTISAYRSKEGEEGEKLVVQQSSSFATDDGFDGNLMLEFFRGKIVAFKSQVSLLHSASRIGRVEIVTSLLESNPELDVNARNQKGESALILAARNGHEGLVRELLCERRAADASVADGKGATALHHAAEMNHVKVAEQLLDKGGESLLSIQNTEGASPLSVAAEHGRNEMVEMLLERCGAEGKKKTVLVEQPRKDGTTALFHAAMNDHAEAVRLLLKHGAVAAVVRTTDLATPLWVASQKGHMRVVKRLVERMTREEVMMENSEGVSASKVALQLSDKSVYNLLKQREKVGLVSRISNMTRRISFVPSKTE